VLDEAAAAVADALAGTADWGEAGTGRVSTTATWPPTPPR
jgi:hypothetical protein